MKLLVGLKDLNRIELHKENLTVSCHRIVRLMKQK